MSFGLDATAPPPAPITEWPKQKAWSISAASNHAACPRKFRYQRIDRLPEPPSPVLERGTGIHAALAHYLESGAWPVGFVPLTDWEATLNDMRARGALSEKQVAFTEAWGTTEWYAQNAWFRAVFDAIIPPLQPDYQHLPRP